MQENFPGVGFSNAVTLFRKTRKIRHCVFTFSKNITLHVEVVHWISKKCTKRDTTIIIVFMAAIL